MKEPITIKYIARMSDIPSATVTVNVQYLLEEFPELKKMMKRSILNRKKEHNF